MGIWSAITDVTAALEKSPGPYLEGAGGQGFSYKIYPKWKAYVRFKGPVTS
jgi:hypothetical protein